MHSGMIRSRALVFFSPFFGFVLLSTGLILRQDLCFCSYDYARSSIFTLPSHLCFTSLTLVGKAYLFPTSSRKIPGLRLIGSDGPKLTNVTWSAGHYTLSGPAWLTFFSLELYTGNHLHLDQNWLRMREIVPQERMRRVLAEDGRWMPAKQEQESIKIHSSFRVLSGAFSLGYESETNHCLGRRRSWAFMTLYKNHMILNIR